MTKLMLELGARRDELVVFVGEIMIGGLAICGGYVRKLVRRYRFILRW